MHKLLIYRPHSWFNKATLSEAYGIQVKVEHVVGWNHICIDGKVFVTNSKDERDAKLEALKVSMPRDVGERYLLSGSRFSVYVVPNSGDNHAKADQAQAA
jgi:hypothetical protein